MPSTRDYDTIERVSDPTIPQYHELMEPVLAALRGLGGSASVREIYERVVEDEKFSAEQQAVLTKDGRMSEIEYRLHSVPGAPSAPWRPGAGCRRRAGFCGTG